MRFKRGTKVEVLSRCKPSESWRCGEIVCRNGHTYTIKYEDAVAERVSNKAIRRCPPRTASEYWNCGDVVEVFNGFSWAEATVMKVINDSYIAVRIVGSLADLKVCKGMIRSRQICDGENWTTIGKRVGKHLKRKTINDELFHDLTETKPERRSTCSLASSSAANWELSNAKNTTCSVGSCSIMGDNPCKVGHRRRDSSLCSDAESYFMRGDEKKSKRRISNEKLAAEIHKLELYAYRCTIEALHASGPLSWDQEAMMTDLRLSLNISNDEHLVEIRNVVSASRCIPF